MLRLLKSFLFLIVLCGLFVLVTACNNSATESSTDDGKVSNVDEQIVHLTKSEQITTMDLTLANDQVSNQFLSMTTEGLFRLDEKGEKVPGIATQSEVSDDGLKWTFHLRDNAEWENGDPVTAHDFVYAWQRAINPDTGSEYGPYLMNGVVKNAKAISEGKKEVSDLGIEAKDDHTLVATLEKPIPYFESLISFGIFNWPLNEEFVEKSGDNYGTSSEYLLSNGPYKLTEWESTSDSWKLEKNASYWDAEEVSIEEFNYNVAKDNQLIVDLYEKGEIDRAELSSDLVDQFQSRDDFVTTPEASVFYLKMNQERTKALGNSNIRKAISRAFDKEALVDNILNNGSIAANGLVPKKFSAHPENGKDFRDINGDLVTYDAEEASELWKKGLEEIGRDSVELEYLSGDSGDSKFISEYMANQLEKNLPGLSITIKRVPLEQLTTLDKSMDYDLQFTGWAPDYQDPFTFLGMWITDENTNKMGYSVEKYDEILARTQSELATKPVERYEALLEAEKILLNTAAIAPVYQTASAKLVSPKLNGVITNAVGPEYEYKWAEVEDLDLPAPAVGNWANEEDDTKAGLNPVTSEGIVPKWRLKRAQAAYYALITHIDHQIGRFLIAMQEYGVYDNTIILFVSDHGELLGDHNLYRKTLPYEGSAKVPFILADPGNSLGLNKNIQIDQVAELRDIMPTLLDIADIEVPSSVEGNSLLSLWKNEHNNWRDYIHGEHEHGIKSYHYITDGREKYIWFSQTGDEQFFDLVEDPNELTNKTGDSNYEKQINARRSQLIHELAGREEGYTDGEQLFAGRPVKPTLEK